MKDYISRSRAQRAAPLHDRGRLSRAV